jgi:hypothetical protein
MKIKEEREKKKNKKRSSTSYGRFVVHMGCLRTERLLR